MNDDGVFYNDNDRPYKSGRLSDGFWTLLLGICFLVFGIIFLSIGVSSTVNDQNYKETEALITDIEVEYRSVDSKTYTVYIQYFVDGKEYNSTLNYYESSFYEGKVITIKYDPENPHEIAATGIGVKILTFGLGGVFALVGIGAIAYYIKNAVKRKNNSYEDYYADDGQKGHWGDLK